MVLKRRRKQPNGFLSRLWVEYNTKKQVLKFAGCRCSALLAWQLAVLFSSFRFSTLLRGKTLLIGMFIVYKYPPSLKLYSSIKVYTSTAESSNVVFRSFLTEHSTMKMKNDVYPSETWLLKFKLNITNFIRISLSRR